jgi:hypothetical protein
MSTSSIDDDRPGISADATRRSRIGNYASSEAE